MQTNLQGPLFGRTERVQPRSLSLSAGQIVQGRIVKLFPNQLAALQMGRITVTARLEAALTAGKDYWFQVQSGSGIPRIKVLDDNMIRQKEGGQGAASSLQQILQQLGLPQTKANEALLRYFSEARLPFTREILVQGGDVLKQMGMLNREGFQFLQGMVQRNIPITNETFAAFRALQQSPSLSTQLQQIIQEGANSPLPVVKTLVSGIQSILNEGQVPQGKSPLTELLMMFSANRNSDPLKQGAEQLLQRLGVLPEGMTKEELYQQFRQAVLSPANRSLVQQLWPNAAGGGFNVAQLDGKTFFEWMISRLSISAGKEGSRQIQVLLSLFGSQKQAAGFTSELQGLQLNGVSLQNTELGALQRAYEATFANDRLNGQGPSTLASQLSRILQSLGMQHEFDVNRLMQGETARGVVGADRLKSLLIQLQQQDLPTSLKEQATLALQRLTGQQLLAAEQLGPLHQVAVQLPLSLGLFQTEMTVQWEGKKTEKGTLDPDHCRVLFYLELENLQETIVDVQIQNRVISVTVLNEHPRPDFLIASLTPSLREALASHDYKLLSLVWKEFKESKQQNQSQQAYRQSVGYQGVDVRI
ncbi:hypothetical protein [Halalkalibacterium ligniniphilum]|uniref:hypothetical protein n=1 Tax=Halalkalibacterium ligniniphilum TaxID=1134413 RepID=UPI00034B30BA|nr:hypothetical protein [Halalkalibacterium ligniniphilum]